MIIWTDSETTGLDLELHDIWELGLVWDDPKGLTKEYTYQFGVDLALADPNALRLNGFYERSSIKPLGGRLAVGRASVQYEPGDKWIFDDARDSLEQIACLTAGATLAGANPAFDAYRLERLMRRHGVAPAWKHRLLDVSCYVAGRLHDAVPEGLATCAAAYGLSWPESTQHTALEDARMAKLVYEEARNPRPVATR